MPDQTPLDVEAIRARLDAAEAPPSRNTLRGLGEKQNAVLQLQQHAPADLRRLLDENARLDTELESLRVHNGVLVTEIRFQADRAEKAIADRDRADRQIRVHLDIARAAERERDEALREAAADKALIAEFATLQDRIPDIDNGDWGLGYDQGYNAALSDVRSMAAPEMPRPPADRVCAFDGCGESCRHDEENPVPPAQEPVSGPETAGTGSGRGTGVTEASGAQGSEKVTAPELITFPAGEATEEWGIRITDCFGTGHLGPLPANEIPKEIAERRRHYRSESTPGTAELTVVHRFIGPWEPAPSLPVPSTEEQR